MTQKEIVIHLFSLADSRYKKFQSPLIPDVDSVFFIGVRTPALKQYAKELLREEGLLSLKNNFLCHLPHKYFEENQLHAFIISEIKDFNECINLVENFLPYVDNWATCDQLCPACFKKNKMLLLDYADRWILSGRTYTVRFGTGIFMRHFLDADFNVSFAEKIASIKSDEYYVNMMIAWYFATALSKQWDSVIKFLKEKQLSVWVHNKTIQKAVESYRITETQKEYLRSLKIHAGKK